MTDSTPAPAAPTPSGTPAPAPAGVDFPGKTLGIVGLVLAILVPLVGLIISVVANNQSKAAGYTNQIAKIGIIVGIVLDGAVRARLHHLGDRYRGDRSPRLGTVY